MPGLGMRESLVGRPAQRRSAITGAQMLALHPSEGADRSNVRLSRDKGDGVPASDSLETIRRARMVELSVITEKAPRRRTSGHQPATVTEPRR